MFTRTGNKHTNTATRTVTGTTPIRTRARPFPNGILTRISTLLKRMPIHTGLTCITGTRITQKVDWLTT